MAIFDRFSPFPTKSLIPISIYLYKRCIWEYPGKIFPYHSMVFSKTLLRTVDNMDETFLYHLAVLGRNILVLLTVLGQNLLVSLGSTWLKPSCTFDSTWTKPSCITWRHLIKTFLRHLAVLGQNLLVLLDDTQQKHFCTQWPGYGEYGRSWQVGQVLVYWLERWTKWKK